MIRAFLTAVAFLTRFPVAVADTTDRDLGRSVAWFPLVGVLLGGMVVGIAYALSFVWPSGVIAVVVVTFLAGVTGGLHLDGLSDVFDGLGGGGQDRARTLAIMRDSRIGAHGATALVLVLVAKVVGVAALLETGDLAGVLAVPALARWAVTPQLVFFPSARVDGLGRAFNGQARVGDLLVATATALALLVALGPAHLGQAGAVLAVSFSMAIWMRSRLGGLTGDVYGATIELCETAALFAASIHHTSR